MGKLHKLIAAAFGINLLHFASNASAQGTSYAKQEWPAYQKNELEELWLEGGVGQGYTSGGSSFRIQLLTNFLIFINQCEGREFNDSPAAEWIRLAYHDMATHNVANDGLGGMDASIRFELDRPENVGVGMTNALGELGPFPSKLVSVADVIALGVVHAARSCEGPIIPFRGGRVDATEAGPPGVPEPHGTLADHTESFRKQGFSPTEMIELVACGHTVGSVRHPDFPDLVPSENPEAVVRAEFDTTARFDNAVVTEYLGGTTKNVLVVHPNKTLISDFRIFSSDGNKTMKALANPSTFQRRCRDLFEKMINTVPRGVVLGDVLKPIKVKVGRSFLIFNNTLALHTEIRFLDVNPARNVTLKWQDKNGGKVHSASPVHVSEHVSGLAERLGHPKMVRYWFEPTINPNSSISKFWFSVDEGGRGRRRPDIYDNSGQGYPIDQDRVVYALGHSYQKRDEGAAGWSLAVAIRNNGGPITDVSADCHVFDPVGGRRPVQTLQMARSVEVEDVGFEGFDIYRVVVPDSPFDRDPSKIAHRVFFDISASVNGTSIKGENLSSLWITKQKGEASPPPPPQPPASEEDTVIEVD